MTSPRLQGLLRDLEKKIHQRPPLFAPSEDPAPADQRRKPPTDFGTPTLTAVPARRPATLPPPQRRTTPEKLATERLQSVTTELPETSSKIAALLLEVALHVANFRNYARGVTQVSFFVPAEIVAHALGIHRSTLYRHLPHLQGLGLVDYRAHHTTLNGRTVSDGTVWSVKLHPTRGRAARVRIEDLRHKWRDLSADIDAGRTAYQSVRQSRTQEQKAAGAELLLRWALPPDVLQTPLSMTVARPNLRGIEIFLDVPHAPKNERSEMVDLAARTIATYLGDDSLNYYRWLLWQLLRLHDRDQDYFGRVLPAIERAGADHREGFARNAGALLTQRLKDSGLWEWLRDVPPHRVATGRGRA